LRRWRGWSRLRLGFRLVGIPILKDLGLHLLDQRIHRFNQGERVQRLMKDSIRPDAFRFSGVERLERSSQKDNLYCLEALVGLDLPAEFDARWPWHARVDDAHIGPMVTQELKNLVAIRDRDDLVTFLAEYLTTHALGMGIIVREKYLAHRLYPNARAHSRAAGAFLV
jgi:hypothetical protein